MLTIGSLFSGIGGLDLGVELATSGRVVWQCEENLFCRRVLAKRWPGVSCHDDVRTFGAHALDCDLNGDCTCGAPEPVDIICGGFPCQDISEPGKGAGLAGERSGLWSEFARVVRDLRPRYVFVENVRALAHRGLGTVLGDLAALGFDAQWCVLGGEHAGCPQRRPRLFILAHRCGVRLPIEWPVDDDDRSDESRDEPDRSDAFAGFPPGPEPAEALQAWIAYHPGLEPWVRRDSYGLSGGLDRPARVGALGNAVVPAQAAAAWEILITRAVAAEVQRA